MTPDIKAFDLEVSRIVTELSHRAKSFEGLYVQINFGKYRGRIAKIVKAWVHGSRPAYLLDISRLDGKGYLSRYSDFETKSYHNTSYFTVIEPQQIKIDGVQNDQTTI